MCAHSVWGVEFNGVLYPCEWKEYIQRTISHNQLSLWLVYTLFHVMSKYLADKIVTWKRTLGKLLYIFLCSFNEERTLYRIILYKVKRNKDDKFWCGNIPRTFLVWSWWNNSLCKPHLTRGHKFAMIWCETQPNNINLQIWWSSNFVYIYRQTTPPTSDSILKL